jgi:NAD(P)-dependent dehydrogenase (short-subunit alcohol dehydrogenase family)
MASERVAVVTGASRGIGLAICEILAEEGFAVALVSRGGDALSEAAARVAAGSGVPTVALPADLSRDEDLMALPQRVHEAFGAPAWMLVNNAGLAESAPLHRSSDELWDRTMRLNLRAPFLLTRLFGRAMAESGGGRIVNLASTASEKGYPYTAAYTASKHALLGATRAQAAEFAGTGVTVNAVCPGYVDTPMTARTIANIMEKTGLDRDAAIGVLAADSPMKRLIQPREVARAVAFFGAPDTDAVTGSTLGVSGGVA